MRKLRDWSKKYMRNSIQLYNHKVGDWFPKGHTRQLFAEWHGNDENMTYRNLHFLYLKNGGLRQATFWLHTIHALIFCECQPTLISYEFRLRSNDLLIERHLQS